MAPALRIAALVARGPALSRLRHAQGVQSAFVSTLLQHIATDVLTAPGGPGTSAAPGRIWWSATTP